jgi:DNA-binding protein WhiA
MTLSERVRDELVAIETRRACCRLAEVSALARTAGTLHLKGGGNVALHIDVATPAVARRAFRLLRSFGIAAEIRAYRRRAFGRETRFELHLGDDPRALQVLNEAGVLDATLVPLEQPPRRVVARSCCRAAYLRGALLAAGSVSGPQAPHLELRSATVQGARFSAGLAAEEGMRLAVVQRGRHAAAYARGGETIAELLGFVGAHDAALLLGEQSVVGTTRAAANRLANADHANLVRTSRAAHAQIRAIRRLDAAGQLEGLAPELRQAADLRLLNPSLSLRELAQKSRPPATKASLQRRLARLQRLAEERRGGPEVGGGYNRPARRKRHGGRS